MTIILPTSTAEVVQEVWVRNKASCIPSGQTLLREDPALREVDLLNWQGSWSTILYDVFQGNKNDVLLGQTGHYFAMYLSCVSLLPTSKGCMSSFADHPVNPLIWIQDNSRGRGFINFAARRLPELAMCLSCNPIEISEESIDDLGQLAISSIEAVYSCPYHLPNGQKEMEGDGQVCLRIMLEAITIFLWIVVDCDIDEDVPPSITGLANLYAWQSYANKSSGSVHGKFYQSIMSCDFPVLGIDLVFQVLSGVSIPGTPPKHESLPTTDHLARVGNGICIYHHAVEDPYLPLETVFRLRFVRGYISYSGFRFKELCGLKGAYVDDGLRLGDLHDELPIR